MVAGSHSAELNVGIIMLTLKGRRPLKVGGVWGYCLVTDGIGKRTLGQPSGVEDWLPLDHLWLEASLQA